MVPGFILGKFKFLPEKATDVCSKIVLYVCQAALMISCFQKNEFSPRIGWNMLITAGVTLVIHIIMAVLVFLVFRGEDRAKLKIMRFASIFSNCGFMGIPFLQMLFSGTSYVEEMVIYAAVVNAVFNSLTWTLGAVIMTGDKKQISLKKLATNPTIIAIVTGVILFFAVGKPLINVFPDGSVADMFTTKIMGAIDMLSDMVTPLSMLVIGLRLATVSFKELFLSGKACLVSLIKLVVVPIVITVCVLFLPIAEEVKYSIFLLLSMPCASSTVLFAVKFNEDSDFASLIVLQSTLFSIVAIPLMFLAFNALLGVV